MEKIISVLILSLALYGLISLIWDIITIKMYKTNLREKLEK